MAGKRPLIPSGEDVWQAIEAAGRRPLAAYVDTRPEGKPTGDVNPSTPAWGRRARLSRNSTSGIAHPIIQTFRIRNLPLGETFLISKAQLLYRSILSGIFHRLSLRWLDQHIERTPRAPDGLIGQRHGLRQVGVVEGSALERGERALRKREGRGRALHAQAQALEQGGEVPGVDGLAVGLRLAADRLEAGPVEEGRAERVGGEGLVEAGERGGGAREGRGEGGVGGGWRPRG